MIVSVSRSGENHRKGSTDGLLISILVVEAVLGVLGFYVIAQELNIAPCYSHAIYYTGRASSCDNRIA